MKKAEKILVTLSLLVLTGALFLIPGASFLSVFFLFALSFFYFYFSFALFNNVKLRHIFRSESYTHITQSRLIGTIGAGLALSLGILGILFRFQSWPGASFNLYGGLILLTVMCIVTAIKYIRTKSAFYSGVLFRTLILNILVLVLVVLPASAIADFKYRNYPAYLQAYRKALIDPENRELQEAEAYEYKKMTESQAQ